MPTKEEMKSFAIQIEKIVREKELNYIEAITHYCEKSGIEMEIATKLIDKPLKTKIARVASDLHLIRRSRSRLPI
jgi:hypothetical protein